MHPALALNASADGAATLILALLGVIVGLFVLKILFRLAWRIFTCLLAAVLTVLLLAVIAMYLMR